MKSLHQLIADQQLDYAVRCYSGHPGVEQLKLKTTRADAVLCQQASIPLYLSGRIPELPEQVIE